MARDNFPDGVAEQLKWYIYRLIDPRNGETFYVGKGQGNRVFDHTKGQMPEDDEILDLKLQRIKEIQFAGLEVGHVIHRHGISTEDCAYDVEAAVIDAYPGLTNKQRGHGTRDLGSRPVEEIIEEYAAEEFEIKEPLLLISINRTYNLWDDPYDAVRFAWKVDLSRAKEYKLVLAHVRGLVVGAYRPTEWLSGSRANFPDIVGRYNNEEPRRYGFKGNPAEDVWDYYVRKRVPERITRTQNAIRYLKAGM